MNNYKLYIKLIISFTHDYHVNILLVIVIVIYLSDVIKIKNIFFAQGIDNIFMNKLMIHSIK